MAVCGEEIGEFRAQPARGHIRESAHVVQRFERRPGGDDAIHPPTLAANHRKRDKKEKVAFVYRGGPGMRFINQRTAVKTAMIRMTNKTVKNLICRSCGVNSILFLTFEIYGA
jgi:hypothetical protein